MPKKVSERELWVDSELARLKMTAEKTEYLFSGEGRKWRFDRAWPSLRIALEVEGFGHANWNRYHGDIEKYNQACFEGWQVFRISSKMIDDGQPAMDFMKKFVEYLRKVENASDMVYLNGESKKK